MPMPGHWNTVSVISAKAISEPIFMAVMVTTGIRQLRSAWRKLMRQRGMPAGPGELDEVGAQHFQHLGAHQPHDRG